MPWKESRAVDERVHFIVACSESEESFAELCRRFGVSRQTGYKWVERYETDGPGGLVDRRPVARTHPAQTTDEVIDVIVGARKEHPFWGPKKLRAWLAARAPERRWPTASTIGEALKRNGLIRPRRRRPRVPPRVMPVERGAAPNDVWCADFKGHFALGDRTRCHPLTISDEFSRYLLKCEGLARPKGPPVREHYERCFREFGLPLGMRTDNGTPFASTAVGGLAELSVWWIRLGIRPLRIEPGEPQQNGVHERMHRTLKQEATQPPAETLVEQQRRFDHFRREFNDERPHEALGMKPPAKVYTLSRRAYPAELREPEYGEGFVVRRCDERGRAMLRGLKVYFQGLLRFAHLGMRNCDEGRHEIFYGPVLLGVLDETTGKPRFIRA
jgi:transposase InsO family protein